MKKGPADAGPFWLRDELLAGVGLVEVGADLGEERVGGRGWVYSAREDLAEADGPAVEGFDRIHVGVDVDSVERGSDEGALGSGVGEDGGVGLPVGVGTGVTAVGAGGDSGVGADLPFGGEQLIGSLLRHEEHDEVLALDSDLGSPATAGGDEEGRPAPAVTGPAGGNATSVLGAEDEASLDHIRDNRDALGVGEDGVGDAVVGGIGEFAEIFGGVIEALGGSVVLIIREGEDEHGGDERGE